MRLLNPNHWTVREFPYFIFKKCLHIYIYVLFYILFHYGLSQDIEYSSLCCRVDLVYPFYLYILVWASQVALVGKNLPVSVEDVKRRVRSLVWEDPLEREMATRSSILAWRTAWTEEPGGLQSMGL